MVILVQCMPFYTPPPHLNVNDGHFECFEQVYGTDTDERFCPSIQEAKQKTS